MQNDFHVTSYNAPKMEGNECEKAQENGKRSSLRSNVRIALVYKIPLLNTSERRIINILRVDLQHVSYLKFYKLLGKLNGSFLEEKTAISSFF